MNKKITSIKDISITHFCWVFIIMAIWAFIIGIIEFVLLIRNMALVALLIQPIFNCIVLWLAVRYSASRINKTYIIADYKKVAVISTVCEIINVIIWNTYSIISNSRNLHLEFLFIIMFSVIQVAIFYIVSRSYIKNTEVEMNLK